MRTGQGCAVIEFIREIWSEGIHGPDGLGESQLEAFFLSSFSAAFEKEIELIALIPQSCAFREPLCSLLFAQRINLFHNQVLLMHGRTSAF